MFSLHWGSKVTLAILYNNFKSNLAQKFSRIKKYKLHWFSAFFYLEAKFRPLKKGQRRLTSMEIKVFRKTTGYTLFDHKRKENILEELKVEPADEKIRRFKSSWLRNVIRMNNDGMPKIVLNYRPNGRRWLGRPLKRLLNEAETGLAKPNSWRMMMMMMMMIMMMTIIIIIQKPKSGLGRFLADVSRSHSGTHAPGRTPLKEWPARRRGRYLHNTQQIKDTNNHTISVIRIPDRSSNGHRHPP